MKTMILFLSVVLFTACGGNQEEVVVNHDSITQVIHDSLSTVHQREIDSLAALNPDTLTKDTTIK